VPAFALLGCLLLSAPAPAQELSPRSFWPTPVGTKVLVLGYAHQSGDVLMDPSIPLYGVDSKIDTALLGYQQTTSLWGRNANVLVELPYSWGATKGLLEDTPARRDFAGFNDASVTLAVNLLGAPAMSAEDFRALRANPRPIVGISLKVLLPTGYYEDDRLINVGGNRWASKLELGAIIPLRPKWLLELEAGGWFFGADNDFVAGKREQDPIWSAEAHLIRRFRPGFWASLEANYFAGGRQTVGGERMADLQSNRRIGATVVIPFGGRHAIKVGYSTGTRTRFGNDFDQFLVTYQTLLP